MEDCVYCGEPEHEGIPHIYIQYAEREVIVDDSRNADEVSVWEGEDCVFSCTRTSRGNWQLDSGFTWFKQTFKFMLRFRSKRISDFIHLRFPDYRTCDR